MILNVDEHKEKIMQKHTRKSEVKQIKKRVQKADTFKVVVASDTMQRRTNKSNKNRGKKVVKVMPVRYVGVAAGWVKWVWAHPSL